MRIPSNHCPRTLGRYSKKVDVTLAGEERQDLLYLKDLVESGKIKAVVDRVYSLEEMMEAHRYIEKGEKKGNVVVTVV